MADFIIDADPYIPSGVPATPEQVAELVADGTLPADKVPDLVAEQQPEDLKTAVLEVIADRVADPETPDVLTDYTDILTDVGATQVEAADAVKGIALEEASRGDLI